MLGVTLLGDDQRTSTKEDWLGENIGDKNFAGIIKFSWNFVQVWMNANVLGRENIFRIHYVKLSQLMIFVIFL